MNLRIAVAVALLVVLVTPDTGHAAGERAPRSAVERVVRRSQARTETVARRLTNGSRLSGLVVQLGESTFELLEEPSMTSHYISYQQVASASSKKRIWITAVASATAAIVVWWLYRNCFFRC
jgi:hypothetical protein